MATNQHPLRNTERGSVHVWVVVVLVVIIIGLLGFVLWQQLTKSDSTNSSNNSNASSNSSGNSTAAQTSTYTATASGYVRSFDYPAGWRVVNDTDMCESFDYCASPPELIVVDDKDVVRVAFSAPQAASDASIDDEALSTAGDSGEVVSGFTSLDGLQARKIEYSDGKTRVLVLFSRGYGYVEFFQSVEDDDMDTMLSTWKWQ